MLPSYATKLIAYDAMNTGSIAKFKPIKHDHALAKFWGRIGVSSEDRPSTGEYDDLDD